MATITITIPCATDPFPYYFCLAYGVSDCTTLCTDYNVGNCNIN